MNSANTTNDQSIVFDHQITWIIAISINSTLIAITMWILLSLVHYGVKTGKWSGTQKRNADKLNAGWIFTSVIACAVMAIVHFTTSQIAHNVGFEPNQDDVCERISDALFVEYSLMLFCTYIFLWLRQRTFYTNEMFNINFGKGLLLLSASSIGIIAVTGLATIVVSTYPVSYPSIPARGCIYNATGNEVDTISWAVCGIVLVLGQALLLALLVYPLAKNLDRQTCCSFSCFDSDAKNSSDSTRSNIPQVQTASINSTNDLKEEKTVSRQDRKTSNRPTRCRSETNRSSTTVKKIMIRTLAFGLLAVFTDIALISILATNLLDQSKPQMRRISVTAYDVNIFLNLVLVIMSFLMYKKMLTSPCRHYEERENYSHEFTSTAKERNGTSLTKV